jgi:hypothetical protein
MTDEQRMKNIYTVRCKRCKGRFTPLGYVKHRCMIRAHNLTADRLEG